MNTWLIRCFAGLLLVLPFVPAVADDPDDKEIARLVKQLGSSDYRMRDAATKRLKELGEPALDALVRATKSNDVEALHRAEAILTVIENRLYVEQRRFICRGTVDCLDRDPWALGWRHHLSPLRAPGAFGVQGHYDASAAHRLHGSREGV